MQDLKDRIWKFSETNSRVLPPNHLIFPTLKNTVSLRFDDVYFFFLDFESFCSALILREIEYVYMNASLLYVDDLCYGNLIPDEYPLYFDPKTREIGYNGYDPYLEEWISGRDNRNLMKKNKLLGISDPNIFHLGYVEKCENDNIEDFYMFQDHRVLELPEGIDFGWMQLPSMDSEKDEDWILRDFSIGYTVIDETLVRPLGIRVNLPKYRESERQRLLDMGYSEYSIDSESDEYEIEEVLIYYIYFDEQGKSIPYGENVTKTLKLLYIYSESQMIWVNQDYERQIGKSTVIRIPGQEYQ